MITIAQEFAPTSGMGFPDRMWSIIPKEGVALNSDWLLGLSAEDRVQIVLLASNIPPYKLEIFILRLASYVGYLPMIATEAGEFLFWKKFGNYQQSKISAFFAARVAAFKGPCNRSEPNWAAVWEILSEVLNK